ncbi:MAG TPA: hypothetical protein VHQ21_14235, partial [Rhodanobacteraceae bacterium]|nr:hypothetical protein [Rhodanobacteraceae bacterium]
MRVLIALTSSLLASLSCFAAETAGRWEGMARIPDFPLHVVVDLDRDSAGAWIGSIIIPELSVGGAPLADIGVHDADVSFAIN